MDDRQSVLYSSVMYGLETTLPQSATLLDSDEIGAPMQEDASQLICDDFQRRLCELLASDEPIEEHPHYKTCVICRCLVRNFEETIENTPGKRTMCDNWREST